MASTRSDYYRDADTRHVLGQSAKRATAGRTVLKQKYTMTAAGGHLLILSAAMADRHGED